MSNLANVGISHATSQPSLYNDLYQAQFPHQMPPNHQYGTLPHKSPQMFYSAGDPMASARSSYGMPPYVGSQPNQTFFPPHMAENVNFNIYLSYIDLATASLCYAK